MADDHIPVTKARNSCFKMFLGCPEGVIYANKAEEGGIFELIARWFLSAATGQRGDPFCAVRTTKAPSSLVDFVQGI